MEDFWPEGNIFEADDEALNKLLDGLTEDAEKYKDDLESLEYIHSLMFKIEEELAYRQISAPINRGIRTSGTRALRKMIAALLARLDATRWLLDEAEDELYRQEEAKRLYG